jgi:hypothetical protein
VAITNTDAPAGPDSSVLEFVVLVVVPVVGNKLDERRQVNKDLLWPSAVTERPRRLPSSDLPGALDERDPTVARERSARSEELRGLTELTIAGLAGPLNRMVTTGSSLEPVSRQPEAGDPQSGPPAKPFR